MKSFVKNPAETLKILKESNIYRKKYGVKQKCGVYVKKLDEKKLEKFIDSILSKKMKLNVEKMSAEVKKGATIEDVIEKIEEYLGDV